MTTYRNHVTLKLRLGIQDPKNLQTASGEN